MFDARDPLRYIESLRREEAFNKGKDDARFGNPRDRVISSMFPIEYNQGYEPMKKSMDEIEKEEKRKRQLEERIDAIKTHKPFF